MGRNLFEYNQKNIDYVVVGLIVSLFFTYPIMLNLLIFDIYKLLLILILVVLCGVFFKYYQVNNIKFDTVILKYIGCFYVMYLIFLLISSLNSYSFIQYSIYLGKFLFFLLLLLFITKSIIVKTLKLYAYLAVLLVIMNIITALGVFLFDVKDFNELTSLIYNNGYRFKVFFGSYYGLSNLNLLGYELYRFQGLSEEAGTFALSLFPAYLYFLYFNKKVELFFILLGMCMSMSAAVPIIFIIIISLLIIIKNYQLAKNVFVALILFLIIFFLNDIALYISNLYISTLYIPNHKLMSYERVQSGQNRLDDIIFYMSYVKNLDIFTKLFGSGAGSPFSEVYPHSISIGWLVKFVEAGIVGGIMYMISFTCIMIFVIMKIYTKTVNDEYFYILSFSVISIIVISSFRQPADASFWHMVLYAFYFMNIKNDFN